MEQQYRDFTVCKKCGGTCYIGNMFCEDCANKLFEEKLDLIEELKNKILELSKLETKLAECEKKLNSPWYDICPRCESPYGASRFVRENGEVVCYNCMRIEDIYKPYIEQVEQQLADKVTRIEELESQFAYECECNKQFVECQKENEMLKQQLTCKEKTINNLLNETQDLKRVLQNVSDKLIKEDKISFAVEQLEKFEEVFSNKIDIICENHKWDFNTRIALQTALDSVKNNQIKAIKGE